MRRHVILVLILLMVWCSFSLAAPFKLSQNEQAWLEAHPEIRVGISLPHPPQSLLDENGVLEGSDPEVVSILNEKFSGRLKIITGTWEKVYNDAKEKQIDVLMNVTPSEERRDYFNYTRPYMSFPHVIVAKKEGKHYLSFASLKGCTIALIKNCYLMSYISEHYPDIKIIKYSNSLETLRAIQRGEADACIDASHILNYLMSKHGMEDLDIHGQSVETSETNVIAVRKDWPILVSLMDRALASISHKKMSAVINKYSKIYKGKTDTSSIDLTVEELDWIQNHPDIIVGASTDWPPYDYVDNGKPVGFANDYISLLADKVGLNIKFVHGYTWNELLDQLRQKEIDILPSLAFRPERQSFINFTKSYMEIAECLILHKDTKKIYTLDDMAGKRLALIKGYSVNKILMEKYPKIKFIYYNSPVEGLVAVSEGRVDGYTDNLGVVNYLRREHLITDLQVVNTQVLEKTKQHIGVRKDEPILKDILEKAMAKVNQNEISELKKTWLFASDMDSGKFYLTSSEKKSLRKFKTLHVGLQQFWAPFEYTGEDGSFQGITTEYINLIHSRLEINLEPTPYSWTEANSLVSAGTIDILPALNNTKERQKYLTFTKPYIRIPMILGTRTDFPYLPHIYDLNGKTIGTGKGYAMQNKLKRDYPGIMIKEYENIEKAMLAVKSKEISAVFTNSAVFSYYKKKLGLEATLQINNTTPYETKLTMGVRNDLAFLVPLLNRMIDGITPEEHSLIMDKWTHVMIEKHIDWKMIVKFGSFGLILFLIVLFWNFKLSVEINKRRKAEESLQASEAKLQSIFRVAPTGIGLVSNRVIQQVNNTMCKITGYSNNELIEKSSRILYPTDEEYEFVGLKKYSQIKEQGVGSVETRWKRKDGEIIDVLLSSSPLDSTDLSAGVTFTALDITSNKKNAAKLQKYADTQAVLLQEVNHRVKNNLTTIIGMLHIEEDRAMQKGDTDNLTPLKVLENRVTGLLTVHSLLSVNMWEPLELSNLCKEVVVQSLRGISSLGGFNLEIEPSSQMVESDMAHHLTLILNELATNTTKHGTGGKGGGEIKISFDKKAKNTICLIYADNGPGFPTKVLNGEISEHSIGIEMTDSVVRSNMYGQIKRYNNGGAVTEICFPVLINNSEDITG